ncbi:hypothetical protein F5882DRAFT_460170 [Hyaloscypha sp. PMI_1271]|nr:hypothetical protein F5882DRAFT_460170 [Hyaloscypha sp. PMI_1271]
MDISGTIQFYDSRVPSSVALTRAIMAPYYIPVHVFNGAPSNNMVVTYPQMQQNNPFSFGLYTGPGQNGPNTSYHRNTWQGFIEEHYSQSPPIKSEPQWNGSVNSPSYPSAKIKTITATTPITGSNDVNFGTEVDTLMKAIQAKTQTTTPQNPSSADQSRPVVGVSCTSPYVQAASQARAYSSRDPSRYKLTQKDVQEEASPEGGKKRYQCTIENCTRSFYQKTHLDIHERAHTGIKPYTHERRHTGERLYYCEICGKRFAQRGNVRAHKIVHDQSKPYLCRLDDCGKQFTQLGNLKSYQNKFHIATIRALTTKFASIKDGDIVHAADKELWEYFANLYKNSNKGIKGRGKDHKVGSNHSSAPSSGTSLSIGGGGYSISGAGRGNMIIDVGCSSGVSSVETCDDDPPLAFGERIY